MPRSPHRGIAARALDSRTHSLLHVVVGVLEVHLGGQRVVRQACQPSKPQPVRLVARFSHEAGSARRVSRRVDYRLGAVCGHRGIRIAARGTQLVAQLVDLGLQLAVFGLGGEGCTVAIIASWVRERER